MHAVGQQGVCDVDSRAHPGLRRPMHRSRRDRRWLAVYGSSWRHMTVLLSGASSAGRLCRRPARLGKPAGADTTVFQSGQIFASVGIRPSTCTTPARATSRAPWSTTPASPTRSDTAFDSKGDIYVADDVNGDISEFAPDGTPMPTFATGLSNPISMVFDNQGNMYVGQQTAPYIAEFAPDGPGSPTSGRSRPSSTATTGSTCRATVHLLLHVRGHGHRDLQQVHEHPGAQLQQVPFPSVDPSTGLPVNAFQVEDPGQRQRPGGRLRRHLGAGPERQPDPDVPVLELPELQRPALRPQRRPERHLLLDSRLGLGGHLPDQHRHRRAHQRSRRTKGSCSGFRCR